MTTLYRPVLIESVEQADQLPEGTFIIDALDLVARLERAGWYAGRWLTEEGGCPNDPVMPAQALVPVEAEEEWAAEFESGEMYVNLDEDSARAADGGTAMSRLVTPWEAA